MQAENLCVPESVDLEDLLQRIADGDRSALGELYHATAPRLLAIALRLVRRRDIAEDVLQEVFVQVWRRAATFDPLGGRAIAWLTTVTRNRALDRLRARQLVLGAEPVDEVLPDLATVEPFAEDAAALRRCIDTLVAEQRRAILLTYWLGLTHEEVAARLEVPLGTAKSWVRRGVIRLKSCVDR